MRALECRSRRAQASLQWCRSTAIPHRYRRPTDAALIIAAGLVAAGVEGSQPDGEVAVQPDAGAWVT